MADHIPKLLPALRPQLAIEIAQSGAALIMHIAVGKLPWAEPRGRVAAKLDADQTSCGVNCLKCKRFATQRDAARAGEGNG